MAAHLQVQDQVQSHAMIPSAAGETAVAAVATRAAAVVQARYAMALRKPRNIEDVRIKLLKECERPTFAAVALYSKPIGGGRVEGPSIRFAEAATRLMGNILVEQPVIFDDHEKRVISITVSDLETNATYNCEVTVNKTVERRTVKQGQEVVRQRLNSKGEPLYIVQASDDELVTKERALVSKAMRTELMRLIPPDIVDECIAQVKATLKDKDAQDPDASRRQVLDGMAAIGVMPSDVEKLVGHPVAQLTPAEVGRLRSIYIAIKDGETTWARVVEAEAPKADGQEQAGESKQQARGSVADRMMDKLKPGEKMNQKTGEITYDAELAKSSLADAIRENETKAAQEKPAEEPAKSKADREKEWRERNAKSKPADREPGEDG